MASTAQTNMLCKYIETHIRVNTCRRNNAKRLAKLKHQEQSRASCRKTVRRLSPLGLKEVTRNACRYITIDAQESTILPETSTVRRKKTSAMCRKHTLTFAPCDANRKPTRIRNSLVSYYYNRCTRNFMLSSRHQSIGGIALGPERT